jgi:hypothetical protein
MPQASTDGDRGSTYSCTLELRPLTQRPVAPAYACAVRDIGAVTTGRRTLTIQDRDGLARAAGL